MPTGERDAYRAPTGPPVPSYAILSDVTPPPKEITAADAWEHSTAVAKRTADALMEIAQSSGAGMRVADDVREVKAVSAGIKRKLKWWQALVIAALGVAGSALIGVAKGLYSQGEKSGIVEMRLQGCERQIDRNSTEIQRLRDMYTELLRDRARRRDATPEQHP